MQRQDNVSVLGEYFNEKERLDYGLDTNQLIRKYSGPIAIKLHTIIKSLPVYTNPKLKTTAGLAVYRNKIYGPHIQLHPACLDKDDIIYTSGEGANVLFHEIAHHIVRLTCDARKVKAHGFEWQYSLMQFNYIPTRCYNAKQHNYKEYKKRANTREIDKLLSDIPDFL